MLASVTLNRNPQHVLVLPAGGKEALQWALPAVYCAFYYKSPVIFARNGQVAAANAAKYKHLKAFLIGPASLVSDAAGNAFASAERVAGRNLADHAVKFAEMRDEAHEFGWGRTHDRRNGYFPYVLTTPRDALAGLSALPYAVSNYASLLYASDEGGIPAELGRYARSQRTDRFVTPSEGLFKHFWVVSQYISYAVQGRLDLALEKAE